MEISTFCLGIDIGYGNLKAVASPLGSNEVTTLVLPIGAAPIAMAPKRVNGDPDLRGGHKVLINGEPWVAGTDPMALQGFARQTHDGYPTTQEYLALFYAALAGLGCQRVASVVTGLPCKHYLGVNGRAQRTTLSERLTGTHWISPALKCQVDKVYVTAQPAGAFTAIAAEDPTLSEQQDVSSLVLDVGFYSVDWVLMQGGAIRDSSSGSSIHATSRILEEASVRISQHSGMPLSPQRLEAVVRRGKSALSLGDQTIDCTPFLDQAATSVAKLAMAEVVSSLRRETDGVQTVVLTGGGARLFEHSVRESFPRRKIVMGNDPVLANAKGFLRLAQHAAQRRAAA